MSAPGHRPRLSLNQATIKHASLPEALEVVRNAGIPDIGLWREPVAEVGLRRAVRLVRDSGLRVSSLCRGGFFTALDPAARRRAIEDNRRAIAETAALAAAGAAGSVPVLVLVPGGLADGGTDLAGARARVGDALAELVGDAQDAGVVLAVEPMHPMYAADRGVISTLGQALDLVEPFPACVHVVIDTFHVWWDPDVLAQIARAGRSGRIAAYQIGDWITPLPPDPLLARGLPGIGHIDLPTLSRAVVDAGYHGAVEVEVFNREVWAGEPNDVARRVAAAFPAVIGFAEPD